MATVLEVLNTESEVLKALAEKQEARVRDYQSRTSVRTFSYLMWLRFFFFALSHTSSALHCVHWWKVLGLSLSCSFVFLLSFLEALIMLYRTHSRLQIICEEHANIRRQIILETRNQANGSSSMEAGASSDGFNFQARALNYDLFSAGEMKVYICVMAFALLPVTAFELYACKYLLCP